MNKEYRNRTYEDAGAQKGFTTKALLSILALILAFALTLSSCGASSAAGSQTITTTGTEQSADNAVSKSEMFTERDLSGEYDESEAETITLSGSSAETSAASGVSIDGSTVTISAEGVYIVSGTLSDGQIIVEVTKAEKVTLVLNNFTGHNESSAVIWVKSADKVYLELKDGTTNTLTDGATYVFANPTDTKPNACIYASDDLSIKGYGTLIIRGNYNNGIGCKNDLSINNAKVIVTAVNNAIKGNGSVTVKGDADVLVEGAEDAIKTDSLDVGKGFLLITENAKVTVHCVDDGLQATQDITVTTGATVTTYAGGNAVNCDGSVNIDEGCLTENVPEA